MIKKQSLDVDTDSTTSIICNNENQVVSSEGEIVSRDSAATTTTTMTQTPTLLQYIVTQNIDGLHRKTNIPRNKMSILHGCGKSTPSLSLHTNTCLH